MEIYQKYIDLLSWKESEEKQKCAIDFLVKARDWNFTNCITSNKKDVWENLVKVIQLRPYNDKVLLISELLFLLKDLNWPGSIQGLEILKSMHMSEIKNPLEESLIEARKELDTVWIAGLKILVNKFNFTEKSFSRIDLNEILSMSDW